MDDRELMAQVVARDSGAFEVLYNRHAGQALAFARRMIAEPSAAEELVQEAFWRVWQRSGTFNAERGNPESWIMGIVHHLAIDELRRRRGQAPVADDDLDSSIMETVPSDDADVLDQVDSGIRRARVREALNTLPEHQRSVIELSFYQGYTHEEIAARLHQPLGTIHTRARLALNKLRMPYVSASDARSMQRAAP